MGRRVHADAAADLPALRRSVLLELALALVVLALTSVLVQESPTAAAATAQPIDVTRTLQGTAGPSGTVEISLAPATSGINSLHLYLNDRTGQPTQPAGIQVALTNRARGIGPLNVILQPAGPGHYVADALNIPGTGTWTLTVTVRVDEFTATTASTTFPVR
jgi:copper transport protein